MSSILALYFLLLPFFWAANIAPDIDLSTGRLFAGAIFLVWAASSMGKRRLVLPTPSLFFLILLFVGTAFLSASWAAEPMWTIRKAVFLLNFFLLLFPLIALLEEPSARQRLAQALAIGAALSGVVGLAQFMSQFFVGVPAAYAFWISEVLPPFLGSAFSETVRTYPSLLANISGATYMRASALFPDPHLFGLYTAMGAALAYGLYRHTRSGIWGVLSLFLCISVALSFSRGAYLAFFVGFMVALWRVFSPTLDARRFLFGIGALIVILSAAAFSPIGERAHSIFSLEDGSNAARIEIWRESAMILSERPLFGVGLGNYPRAVSPTADYREPIYAHSLYLDLPLELGILGAPPFFLLLAAAFLRLLSRSRREAVAEGALLALIVFLVHSVFETPIFSVHILPALMLIFALAFARSHPPAEA